MYASAGMETEVPESTLQGKEAQRRHRNYLLVFFPCIFITMMVIHGMAKNTSDIFGALFTLIYLILSSS